MAARPILGSARFGFSRVFPGAGFSRIPSLQPFSFSFALLTARAPCDRSGDSEPPGERRLRVASRVVSPASRRCPAGFSPNLRQFCTRTPPATRRTPSAMRRFGIPRGSRTPPKSSEAPSACSMAHVGQGHAKGARASMRLPDRSVIRFRRACTSRIRTACRRSRLPWGGA